MKSTIGLTTVNRDNQSFRKADDTPFDFRKGDFVVIELIGLMKSYRPEIDVPTSSLLYRDGLAPPEKLAIFRGELTNRRPTVE